MSILTAGFNPTGATNGSTVLTTDAGDLSAWDTMLGGSSFTYDNTHTLFGKALAGKIAASAATVVSEWVASYAIPNGGTDFGRAYLYFNTLPSGVNVKLIAGGNPAIRINNSTNTISLVNGSTVLATSTTVITTGQWYRFEWTWFYSSSTGTASVSIYTSPNSTTAAETLSASSQNFGASGGSSIFFGLGNSCTSTLWLAQIAAKGTAAIGPYPVNSVAPSVSGSAPQGSTLTASAGTWNGTFTMSYQWTRDGANIGGATGTTYVTQAADVGHAIGVTETATGQQATNESASQASSNTVTVTSSSGLSTIIGKTGTSGTAVMQKAYSGYTQVTGSTHANGTPIDQKGAPGYTKVKGH